MAEIFRETQQEARSLDVLTKFQSANANDAGSHFLLGTHFHDTADLAEALKHYERARELSPDHSEILRLLGRVHYELRQYDAAREYLELSLANNPRNGSTVRYLAELELTTGRLESGWDLLSDRRSLSVRPVLTAVGKDRDHFDVPIKGKNVLIMREQGLGDEIRWSGCYDEVIEEAAHCIIQCDQRLAPIFSRSFPDAELFPIEPLNTLKETPPLETFDLICLAGDLTARYRRNISEFPKRDYVLKPDPEKAAHWRARFDALNDNLKVGICWRSEVLDWYRMRNAFYTHLDEWGDILRLPGATFVNLHYGDCAYELEQAEKTFGVHIHEWPDVDLRDDLDSVFALISELDLVITVQTAVWNMAGAVGTETLAILNPIMRLGTNHIPWYKSVMPVQQDLGDSSEVVLGRIAAELRARIAAQR